MFQVVSSDQTQTDADMILYCPWGNTHTHTPACINTAVCVRQSTELEKNPFLYQTMQTCSSTACVCVCVWGYLQSVPPTQSSQYLSSDSLKFDYSDHTFMYIYFLKLLSFSSFTWSWTLTLRIFLTRFVCCSQELTNQQPAWCQR